MEKQLGTVRLSYNRNTKSLYSTFIPTMSATNKVQIDVDCKNPSPAYLKEQAELSMAKWFSLMNEVELADREEYTLELEEKDVHQYSTGELKDAEYIVTFKKK